MDDGWKTSPTNGQPSPHDPRHFPFLFTLSLHHEHGVQHFRRLERSSPLQSLSTISFALLPILNVLIIVSRALASHRNSGVFLFLFVSQAYWDEWMIKILIPMHLHYRRRDFYLHVIITIGLLLLRAGSRVYSCLFFRERGVGKAKQFKKVWHWRRLASSTTKQNLFA